VQALCELIERDVYRGTYGRIGRPNFTSIYHIIHEPADTLEEFREECEQALRDAEREREERGIRLGLRTTS